MIHVKYFIHEVPIECAFADVREAIDFLSNKYTEITGSIAPAIFLSREVAPQLFYDDKLYINSPESGFLNLQYYATNGVIPITVVVGLNRAFVYVGTKEGYINSLIDQRFEEVFFGDSQ